jgi:hypothetical protein
MKGWIEVSVTLRGFAADPQEVAQFLGTVPCEIRRAGERTNNVSQAKYKDNSIRVEAKADDAKEVTALITQILRNWGGVTRVEEALQAKSVKFTDIDIAIYDEPAEYSNLSNIFLDEHILKDIARLSGSISFSLQPVRD